MLSIRTIGTAISAGFALAALAARVAFAEIDADTSSRVDATIRAQMQEQRIPGTTLAVVRDGKVIKAPAYGLANLELRVPATVQSVYEIGSITKQVTAAANPIEDW